MTAWMFGWLFLAAVLVAIPLATMLWEERRYQKRRIRRRLRDIARLHEWEERCVQLHRQDELRMEVRKAPEAFRPSGGNGDKL